MELTKVGYTLLVFPLLFLAVEGLTKGDSNVCEKVQYVTKSRHASFSAAYTSKYYSWCSEFPLFRCTRYRRRYETRYRVEYFRDTWKTYHCCQGFSEYNGWCDDINECADWSKNDCYMTCINTPGSYYCRCEAGYQGEGRSCTLVATASSSTATTTSTSSTSSTGTSAVSSTNTTATSTSTDTTTSTRNSTSSGTGTGTSTSTENPSSTGSIRSNSTGNPSSPGSTSSSTSTSTVSSTSTETNTSTPTTTASTTTTTTRLSPCIATTCKNGGKCYVVSDKKYRCKCPVAWEGENCERDVNECARKTPPCPGENVDCINLDGGYTCRCREYFLKDGSGKCSFEANIRYVLKLALDQEFDERLRDMRSLQFKDLEEKVVIKIDAILHSNRIFKKLAGFSQIRFFDEGSVTVDMALGFYTVAPLADPKNFTTDLRNFFNGVIKKMGNVCHLEGVGNTVCSKPPKVEDFEECRYFCKSEGTNCTNLEGSYLCSCRTGYYGEDPTRTGCTVEGPNFGEIMIYATMSFLAILCLIAFVVVTILKCRKQNSTKKTKMSDMDTSAVVRKLAAEESIGAENYYNYIQDENDNKPSFKTENLPPDLRENTEKSEVARRMSGSSDAIRRDSAVSDSIQSHLSPLEAVTEEASSESADSWKMADSGAFSLTDASSAQLW
ncbi:mucin-13-like [Lineus longissimus]|uniref:mucin-13-like n=1 Tax=Lineus longissimus TaxID=88925 RepID=UPI002B4EC2F2